MISVATPKAVVSYFLFFSWLLKIDFSVFFFFVVGKTSLITRFMYDSFDNTYQVRGSLGFVNVYLD